jgi:hypothetical protein
VKAVRLGPFPLPSPALGLFSVASCRKRRARQLADMPGVHIPVLPAEHLTVFAEAEAVVQQYLDSSSYHFVPHAIFDYVKRVNELAGIKVETTKKRRTAAGGDAKKALVQSLPPDTSAAAGSGMMGLQED